MEKNHFDRSEDFKFYEKRNLAVFTTKQVLEGAPILFAYHNDDGAWQFHTNSEPNEDDARIVCLDEITQIDPTTNELYRLDFGWQAWREEKGAEWQFAEDDNG